MDGGSCPRVDQSALVKCHQGRLVAEVQSHLHTSRLLLGLPQRKLFQLRHQYHCELQPLSGSCIASQCDRRHYGHKLWRVARQFVQNRFGGLPRELRHFIVVSPFSERILKPFLSPDSQIYHVQNPVQASYQDPVGVEANSAFVMVGRIAQEKGPQLFAEAASQLGCEAVFIGDGDQRADVLRRCPTAKMLGWLSREEVTTSARWSPSPMNTASQPT